MTDKFISFIDKTLNTRITPLAYLIAIHSLIFGGSFVFLSGEQSVRATLLYQTGVIGGIQMWGMLVLVSAVLTIYGMARRVVNLTQLGATGLFMGWLFASITYGQNELWLQMILAGVLMLCFGYHFLAAGLGRLWDYTP